MRVKLCCNRSVRMYCISNAMTRVSRVSNCRMHREARRHIAGLIEHFHHVDTTAARPGFANHDRGTHSRRSACKYRFNATIAPIANEAVDTDAARFSFDENAEADTLHQAFDANAFHHALRRLVAHGRLSIAKCHAVFARVGCADEHAVGIVELDRLCAAEGVWAFGHRMSHGFKLCPYLLIK